MALLQPYPSRTILCNEFVGKDIDSLRTPALVINRDVFAKNCEKMHASVKEWGAKFRAHVKTHKTAEGVRLQLVSGVDKTHSVVVSTLMEAWQILQAGLVADGTVKDILYGLPINVHKIPELSKLSEELATQGAKLRIFLDHPGQIEAIVEYVRGADNPRPWSSFIKVDVGEKRAGQTVESEEFKSLLQKIWSTRSITIFGFYCHAGGSYSSTSLPQASSFLSQEVQAVNRAAEIALSLGPQPAAPYILSVGSTPTAHAASSPETRAKLAAALHGELELHAGNYPMLDLQQLHTSLIDAESISQKVLATVISYYPGRGADISDEALCDAGALAMSRDTGPSGGYGDVVSANGRGWQLGRISQEHGILVRHPHFGSEEQKKLQVGDIIEIVGQHACLTAASFPWFYVVEGEGRQVVDVWVPWKGW
ncbi:hypothetical protein SISSUDRAFT_862144 [Sistotremastrum suecicum HHB10207 ss-3]|uniref:D-serine dehydratase n=1 Tax=Sistotremastrum suecicum HHB10207 ss-3 TaxID=1314776 RepID=A0A166CF63_9AGAM|nr:hypothetical protein SISSUDRAFT_862144 [Sistotremastrum suecicum HHB10207 ss-3]